MNKKTYLVTGGTGFIGSALVHRLIKEGHYVVVVDNNSRGNASRLQDIHGNLIYHELDIRNLIPSYMDVDAVIHLAAVNGTSNFYQKPETVLEVAVKGMINVLQGCIDMHVKEFFLASSSEVYQSPPVIPTPENVPMVIPDPYNPRYSYAGGKIISELMLINYARKHFDRAVIFRPHNIFGPGMGNEHVIPQFINQMLPLPDSPERSNFQIQGTGRETRAFCYIDDFIDGLMLLLEKGQHMNTYNIGTQKEVRIDNVAYYISKILNKNITIEPTPLSEGSTPRRCPDISKIASLGYAPKVSLIRGLKKTTEWYKNDRKNNKSI